MCPKMCLCKRSHGALQQITNKNSYGVRERGRERDREREMVNTHKFAHMHSHVHVCHCTVCVTSFSLSFIADTTTPPDNVRWSNKMRTEHCANVHIICIRLQAGKCMNSNIMHAMFNDAKNTYTHTNTRKLCVRDANWFARKRRVNIQ